MSNLPVTSVKELLLIQINHLDNIKSELSKNKMIVQTRGFLEQEFIRKKKSNYSLIYDVILKDESSDDYVFINLPMSLVEKHNLTGGEFVEITGSAEIDKYYKLQIRVNVINVNKTNNQIDVAFPNLVTDQLTTLKSFPKKRSPFPFGKSLNIALMQPISNTAAGDFKKKMPSSGIHIQDYSINIESKTAILECFKTVLKDNQTRPYKFNVLAIIRGGGNGFEVFDDLEVCQAFANIDMHKIVGLGHEENRCLIEFVSDHAEATPSYLATYLIHQLDSVAKNKSQVKYYNPSQTTNEQNNKLENKLNWIIGLIIFGLFIVIPVITKIIK